MNHHILSSLVMFFGLFQMPIGLAFALTENSVWRAILGTIWTMMIAGFGILLIFAILTRATCGAL